MTEKLASRARGGRAPRTAEGAGVVVGFVILNGQRRRVAHATIMADGQVKTVLEVPRAVQQDIDNVTLLAEAMLAFSARVRRLARPYLHQGG